MTIPLFPTLPTIGHPKRSVIWSTMRQPSVGGQESRFSLWSSPRWRYEFPFEVLRQSAATPEFATLAGFYNGLGGDALAFQYSDPSDGSVTAQAFGTGDGTTRAFQLVRSLGGFAEPVYLPAATPTIYVNGTPSVALTIGATGIVTFTAAPAAAAALTWTGAFTWLCNFDDANLDFQQFGAGFWSMQSLKFSTVKL